MADAKVAIVGSVSAAIRAYIQNIRAAAVAGLVGAVLTALFSMLGVSVPALGLVWTAVAIVVAAYVYAALLGAALHGEEGLQQRVAVDGGRVLGSLVIVGFFLLIVFVVVAIIDIFILAVAMTDYLPQLQAAGQDQQAVMAVLTRFAQQRPGALIAVGVVDTIIWMALTSRLFIAAPASYDLKRILSFETWRWTKGNLLRITGARLLLLAPAYILMLALSFALNAVLGISIFDPVAAERTIRAAPAQFAALSVFANFVQFALYSALEAALSVQIYKALRPQGRAPDVF